MKTTMTWINWEKESRLVFDLKAGLEAALEEKELELETSQWTGIPGFNDANIKVNKIVHRAIEQFDLPILSTWYRYGQYEPHEEFTPSEVQPRTLDHHAFPAEASIPYRDFPSAKEFKGFFLECDIESILEQDLYEFLQENYTKTAPSEYKQLYLANLQVFKLLDEMTEEENLTEDTKYYRDQMGNYTSRIRRRLIANPTFDEETVEIVIQSLRAIKQALVALSQTEDIQSDQIGYFETAREEYHESIWPLPAIQISIDKASGVEADEFKNKGREMLRDIRDEASNKSDELTDDIYEMGLAPTEEDYRTIQDDLDESWKKVENSAIRI
ncbi:Uncharacterized protein HSR121_1705 [Halapricum desulfuricans]|uniref:DUF8098 domain-containing protein n=1 Tax=Halapricum desulfuricans TaxID=2841257 RepID=A0A897MZF9_9EURY|nr:Uncharacterized protein HSR121_1705 [Halapricum desulfuricans]